MNDSSSVHDSTEEVIHQRVCDMMALVSGLCLLALEKRLRRNADLTVAGRVYLSGWLEGARFGGLPPIELDPEYNDLLTVVFLAKGVVRRYCAFISLQAGRERASPSSVRDDNPPHGVLNAVQTVIEQANLIAKNSDYTDTQVLIETMRGHEAPIVAAVRKVARTSKESGASYVSSLCFYNALHAASRETYYESVSPNAPPSRRSIDDLVVGKTTATLGSAATFVLEAPTASPFVRRARSC